MIRALPPGYATPDLERAEPLDDQRPRRRARQMPAPDPTAVLVVARDAADRQAIEELARQHGWRVIATIHGAATRPMLDVVGREAGLVLASDAQLLGACYRRARQNVAHLQARGRRVIALRSTPLAAEVEIIDATIERMAAS